MTYEDNDGVVRFLPGYKFDPIDEILVDFYLKMRVFSQPLPIEIIPDFNVFQTEPWSLPGGDGKIFNERKCFFHNTMGHDDLENLDMRVAESGLWKVMEKGKDVPIPTNNEVIGKRNIVNYWEVQGDCARRTRWIMHEFRLASITNPSKKANWAAYRIFQIKDAKNVKNAKNSKIVYNGESSNNGSVEVFDFSAENGSFSSPPK
ncbi:NAC domain-containing protein 83-like [Lotus japonicus]|uniref:NAC domain-containing protein 83-like n=1 Tax=Lotus japonicus TaxID=34305 RepID=UPI0025852E96|nr:NAC domain-containing protein 83-like [Lotus japonicus]